MIDVSGVSNANRTMNQRYTGIDSSYRTGTGNTMHGIEQLPPELLRKAHPLDELGLREVVWEDQLIEVVIDALEQLNFAVLGGDVYAATREGFRSTYDNWYCNRTPDEAFSQYAGRSREEARKYVRSYRNAGNVGRYFAVVVSNEVTAGEGERRA